jgi:hypothetical protein
MNPEFCMILFLLCVSLVLGLLALRHEVGSALGILWLHLRGVRVRAVHPARVPLPRRHLPGAFPEQGPPPSRTRGGP